MSRYVTNSNFRIPISLQRDDENLWYFKLWLFETNRIHNLEYLWSSTLGYKYIGIRNSELAILQNEDWLEILQITPKEINLIKWSPVLIFWAF